MNEDNYRKILNRLGVEPSPHRQTYLQIAQLKLLELMWERDAKDAPTPEESA